MWNNWNVKNGALKMALRFVEMVRRWRDCARSSISSSSSKTTLISALSAHFHATRTNFIRLLNRLFRHVYSTSFNFQYTFALLLYTDTHTQCVYTYSNLIKLFVLTEIVSMLKYTQRKSTNFFIEIIMIKYSKTFCHLGITVLILSFGSAILIGEWASQFAARWRAVYISLSSFRSRSCSRSVSLKLRFPYSASDSKCSMCIVVLYAWCKSWWLKFCTLHIKTQAHTHTQKVQLLFMGQSLAMMICVFVYCTVWSCSSV